MRRSFPASFAAIIGAIGFVTMTPAVSSASLIFYTSRASFNAAEPGLPVQGFSSANTFSQPYVLQSSPLSSATNGPVFAAGSILPGLTISNLNPAVAPQGLIVEGGSVGDNYFGDSLVLSFAPNVTAVGTNVFANTSPGPSLAGNFTADVFNGSTHLGSTNFSEAGSGGFFGVSSTTPITSVQLLYTTDDATTFVNNIAFGPQASAAATPEPSTFVLLALGAFTIGLRYAANRRRRLTTNTL